MKLNLNKELLRDDGTPYKLSEKSNEVLTALRVVQIALNTVKASTDAEKKYLRGCLLEDTKNPERDFKAEEIAEMKKAVGEFIDTPQVLKIVWDLLDGKS